MCLSLMGFGGTECQSGKITFFFLYFLGGCQAFLACTQNLFLVLYLGSFLMGLREQYGNRIRLPTCKESALSTVLSLVPLFSLKEIDLGGQITFNVAVTLPACSWSFSISIGFPDSVGPILFI